MKRITDVSMVELTAFHWGRRTIAAALLASMFLGPATWAGERTELAQARAEDMASDPIEPVNRFVFGFNQILEQSVLGMLGSLYNAFVPPPARQALGNAFDNLRSPVILANDLMQLEFERAGHTVGRFLMNSTVGLGGLFDVAAEKGLPKHDEDFGQTLGRWGVGEGFYLVLPILGPSNPRDALGKYGADPYLDPLGLWLSNTNQEGVRWLRNGGAGVDEYARVKDELEKIKKTSVDYYATIRSMYRQKREAEIRNSDPKTLPPIPDYDLAR